MSTPTLKPEQGGPVLARAKHEVKEAVLLQAWTEHGAIAARHCWGFESANSKRLLYSFALLPSYLAVVSAGPCAQQNRFKTRMKL